MRVHDPTHVNLRVVLVHPSDSQRLTGRHGDRRLSLEPLELWLGRFALGIAGQEKLVSGGQLKLCLGLLGDSGRSWSNKAIATHLKSLYYYMYTQSLYP